MYILSKAMNNIFTKTFPLKKISKMYLEIFQDVLITYVAKRGEARPRVMLHLGARHSNNCQIILKLFGYDTFCNNLQQKISNLEVSEVLITYVTNSPVGGRLG